MEPTATAGGGVMYSKIIRKEDKYAKRVVSMPYNKAARNMSFSNTAVIASAVTATGR